MVQPFYVILSPAHCCKKVALDKQLQNWWAGEWGWLKKILTILSFSSPLSQTRISGYLEWSHLLETSGGSDKKQIWDKMDSIRLLYWKALQFLRFFEEQVDISTLWTQQSPIYYSQSKQPHGATTRWLIIWGCTWSNLQLLVWPLVPHLARLWLLVWVLGESKNLFLWE